MFGTRSDYPHVQPSRRKRPTISCSECHRRKQKCDRRQPCFHCTRRGKSGRCLYEQTADEGVYCEPSTTELEINELPSTLDYPTDPTPSSGVSVDSEMSRRLGYSSCGSTGTLKILSQLGESDRSSTTVVESPPNYDTASQYIRLIREIPSRKHVDILVRSFFANVAWQYDVIDEAMFRNDLLDWGQVSYPALKQGPECLPIRTRYFPALLLQVLALALLSQPTQYDDALEDLKYASGIDFPDLAADYSIAGHRLMCLLGVRNMPLSRVQAGLMKACFEKSIGSVIECWHTLGSTIRDAQELGLHLLRPCGISRATGDAAQPQKFGLGRKLWLVLHLWDAHMAVVLGRPMITKLDPCDVSSTSPSTGFTSQSLHGDTFSPFDIILCGYHAAFKYLQDIYALETANQQTQKTVKTIHDAIMSNIFRLPVWATASSLILDVKYPWLPIARETLLTEIYFVLLALHRPFMWSVSSSREEALKAVLQMLESQNRLFSLAKPNVYTNFTLVFGTFDAMVLVAATYLEFPDDNPDLLPASMTCMEWGLARLDAMRSRNTMASLAYNVVQGLYQKLCWRMPVSEPPVLNNDEARDPREALQAHGGEDTRLEALQVTGASMITHPDLHNSLWQQPIFDLASHDAIGDIWQLMDDLT